MVVLDKESYIEKMQGLLSYTSRFERLEIPLGKHFNFVIYSQDKVKNILKSLHDKERYAYMLYKAVSPMECRPEVLYVFMVSIIIFHILD